jgi:sigma-B regulation protein RsbU (phosphoserine phosphatase)
MKVLIAEDDEAYTTFLRDSLDHWGYEIFEARNGREAYDLINKESINLVISDWMMPEMDGLDLCNKIRQSIKDKYVYFILLTAKSDKKDLVEGMESGADSFIVKSYNSDELEVCVRAGVRILELEETLNERNNQLGKTNKNLTEAYEIIEKDLEAASKIQKNLLPEFFKLQNVDFDWIFLPSSYVAGDTFNYFKLNENEIGFYIIDVAGHGVAAALSAVTLSQLISPSSSDEKPFDEILINKETGESESPSKVLSKLNKRFQSETCDQYFTMIYGIIDTKNNRIKMAQAGHPNPILLRNGEANFLKATGFPIGLIPNVEYDESSFEIREKDRIFFYSDGLTDCCRDEERFSDKRLIDYLHATKELKINDLTKDFEQNLSEWQKGKPLADDITFLAMQIN